MQKSANMIINYGGVVTW